VAYFFMGHPVDRPISHGTSHSRTHRIYSTPTAKTQYIGRNLEQIFICHNFLMSAWSFTLHVKRNLWCLQTC